MPPAGSAGDGGLTTAKTAGNPDGDNKVPSSIPRRQVLSDLLQWEGDIHHLYLDKHGLVTVGIGNLVKSAAGAEKLPFVDARTGQPATREQIDAAFEKVRAHAAGHGAQTYAHLTEIRLSEDAVGALTSQRLDNEFVPGLRGLFVKFEQFPPQAQRALIDMAYNLGLGGLSRFNHLRAACDAGDWTAAASDCHRRTCRAERNDWTRDLFIQAAATSSSGVS